MVIVIDNYDSFTYNLVQYLWELGAEVSVYRNDEKTAAEIVAERPAQLVISPGPCTPDQAGISLELIKAAAAKRIPLLGVCLGHQSIGQAFGGVVERAARLMHGKTSSIRHDGRGVFTGVPSPFTATRYHSLVVNDKLPACLEPTAWTVDADELMGLRHRELPIEGVQFHPESFLTEHGHQLLRNFLGAAGRGPARASAAAKAGGRKAAGKPAAARKAAPAKSAARRSATKGRR